MLEDSVYLASREGDLPRLKRFVEVDGHDINVIDDWDATPLYYAALCGHIHVVQYLLERGARCEPNTFDGERCFYAALTDDIRRLLHSYQAANKQRGPLFAFTFRIFNSSGGKCDFELRAPDGWTISVHKWLLAARSRYFRAKLDGPWRDRESVRLTDPRMSGQALHAVLSWMYTERLMAPVGLLPKVHAIARNLKMHGLVSFLNTYKPPSAAAVVNEDGSGSNERIVALDLGKPYRVGTVPVALVPRPGRHPQLLVPETDLHTVYREHSDEPTAGEPDSDVDYPSPPSGPNARNIAPLSSLRAQAWRHVLHERGGAVIPALAFDPRWDQGQDEGDDVEDGDEDEEHAAALSSARALHADLLISVAGVLFPCHSSVVTSRSKYLDSALDFQSRQQGDGQQTQAKDHGLATLTLDDMSPPAFGACLEWMYCDAVRPLAPVRVLETLAIADQLLLQDIKPVLVAQAIRQLSTDTVMDAWRLGEQLGLQRLSESCALYTAHHLEAVLALRDMADLARESAASIAGRQEYDSVPVLDEIKAAIRSTWGTAVLQDRQVEVARGYEHSGQDGQRAFAADGCGPVSSDQVGFRDMFGMRVTVLSVDPVSGLHRATAGVTSVDGLTGTGTAVVKGGSAGPAGAGLRLVTHGRPVARHLWDSAPPIDGGAGDGYEEDEDDAEDDEGGGQDGSDLAVPSEAGEWDPRTSTRGTHNGFKALLDQVPSSSEPGEDGARATAGPATGPRPSPSPSSSSQAAGGQDVATMREAYATKMALVDAFAAQLGFKTRR